MKRKFRILKKKDFQATLKTKNQKIYTNNFVFYYQSTKNENIKFGYIVSKKHFKKAVERNYCRRVVDCCVYQSKHLETLLSYNCVFYFRKELINTINDFVKIQKEVDRILFNFKKAITKKNKKCISPITPSTIFHNHKQ
ncbi:Ribonuclease P protein component [[Mycoplasma] cavipharyngis]|uniref:ribonuclease P protein component n=1 Tax=[Mycoplasma] cavipharyngis TaxID=92757 RepID=UPI00370436EF